MSEPHIRFEGDSTLVVLFEERIDESINARVAAIARQVAAARVPGVHDVVPTFHTAAVHFDPAKTDIHALERLLTGVARAAGSTVDVKAGAAIQVDVEYGGEGGPDLADVASFAGVRPEDVVAIHSSRTYRVFMLGFVPGFAYMAAVDERIAMPRLDTPRTRVPAGSVAIAGVQTGIYPSATPGGWRLIGRTSIKAFDPGRATPCLFQAGDRVRFVPQRVGR